MSDLFKHNTGFLHGGDYNPDQWLDREDILEQDVRYMKQANVNCVSLAIFSWTKLEPSEGHYDFAWLDQVIERLWKNGIYVILATPSGAKPAWMAADHPETLRVNDHFQRMHFGERHNHCLTSPYYRKKVVEIDTLLARQYAHHPAVILWHLSNEYGGVCHCEHCQASFRNWLKDKYKTLDNLNSSWCTGVWSQTYTEWEQIESPTPVGEMSCVSLRVDWQRFMSDCCKDFIRMEKDAVKSVDPSLPVTANLMERFWDYDYFSLAEELDIVSWDSYPEWHSGDDIARAAEFAMNHDIMRSLKKQPFLLMESTPSLVNWKPINKLKRPGMHMLASMQAVAHGSNSVQYFQWRKCRGGPEAFHGAVVSHDGRNDTRVFREVSALGSALKKIQSLCGTDIAPKVCIIYDWHARWAVDFAQAGQKEHMRYFDTVGMYYRALWRLGLQVDFCDMRDCTDLSPYTLVIAPMLFMFRNGFEDRLKAYVANGGTLLMSYFSGIVNETDLTFLGDTPFALTDVLGLRVEEMDALYPDEVNHTIYNNKQYTIRDICEICVPTTAVSLATYQDDFYRDRPVITRNQYQSGKAYYVAARVEQSLLDDFIASLTAELKLVEPAFSALPEGVICSKRGDVYFLQNYTNTSHNIDLKKEYQNILTDDLLSGPVTINPYGVLLLRPSEH